MMTAYLTAAGAGKDEFTEKRSRFIGHILPVTTAEEAEAFVAATKKEYWDARHNVWAYVLRRDGIRRYSDDGEPQGTAGMPVLDVLQKEGLTDCAVVVTRYFGGILLGGGGLVRAYSHAAKLAVDAAGRCEMRPCTLFDVTCDYAQYGFVAPLVAACGGTVDNADFLENVQVSAHIPSELFDGFCRQLTEQSAGRLTAVQRDEKFIGFSVK